MISDTEREELKAVIGSRYTRKVLAILNEKKAVSSAGKNYSIEYIRQVFNGHHSNLEVELAVYELRDKIISDQKELIKKKRNLTDPEKDLK